MKNVGSRFVVFRVTEIYFLLTTNITKENSMLIREMVGEECFMQMDRHTKDNG